MADSVGVIGEALAAAALAEAASCLLAPDSKFWGWLEEVSRPPGGLLVESHARYSGVLFIVGNVARRALLLEHRVPVRERGARTRRDTPHRQRASHHWDDYLDEEDDGFPSA